MYHINPKHRWAIILVLSLFSIWLEPSDQAVGSSRTETSEGRLMQDFVEYWGAARLLVTGHNPYSPKELLALQRSVGTGKNRSLMMYNPPWTLFFLLPFGFLSISMAWVLWLAVNVSCLLLSAAHLWRLYGGALGRYRLSWLVCFAVFPTYLVLYLSQITPLVLVGITGFLYFQAKKEWWLAGLMLPLVAIKPHLASFFWIALIVSELRNRRWQLIASGVVAGGITSLVPFLFAPSIFHDYVRLLWIDPPSEWATPTLGKALESLSAFDSPLVSYLPLLCGLAWFGFYWRRYRDNWDWIQQTPLLLLVSLATTVFAWTFDQVVLLPVLIEGTVWGIRDGWFRGIAFGSSVFLLVNLPQLLRFNGILFPNEFWLFWMVPVFLLAYSAFRLKAPREPIIYEAPV